MQIPRLNIAQQITSLFLLAPGRLPKEKKRCQYLFATIWPQHGMASAMSSNRTPCVSKMASGRDTLHAVEGVFLQKT